MISYMLVLKPIVVLVGGFLGHDDGLWNFECKEDEGMQCESIERNEDSRQANVKQCKITQNISEMVPARD